jgi:hypothetical protein
LPIHADAESKRINGEYWHSDVSCDEEPPMGSILYLHTVPDCGRDTLFASQYAAYEALSPRMKAYLEGLTAIHSGDHVYRKNNALMGIAESGKVYPKASHPIVRTHPVTKRKALYVNGQFTTHINGLPSDEGRAVLDFLCEFCARLFPAGSRPANEAFGRSVRSIDALNPTRYILTTSRSLTPANKLIPIASRRTCCSFVGFRPLFLLAGIFAVLSIGLWLPEFEEEISIPTTFSPVVWHAHEMLYGYLVAAVSGFLLTAILGDAISPTPTT